MLPLERKGTPARVDLSSPDFDFQHFFVRKLVAREGVSELYRCTLHLALPTSANADVTVASAIGAAVRIELVDQGGTPVGVLHGIVDGASITGGEESHGLEAWEITVAPRAARLALVTTQEIFMQKSVPAIIAAKLEEAGLGSSFAMRLSGTYPEREFVVQYRETDLDFICRLAEHVGISFSFEQGEDEEIMVFTDDTKALAPELSERVVYSPRRDVLGVFELTRQARIIPTVYAVQDYNYRNPNLDVGAIVESALGSGGGVVEYGAHQKDPDEGRWLAKVRAEEAEGRACSYAGVSVVGGLSAGVHFALESAPPWADASLFVVRVEHELSTPLGGDASEAARYVNRFTAISSNTRFRPARSTPRPRIHGVVSAVVQGSGGSSYEANLDPQGRYLVQFHFDTAEPGLPQPSRPVRMSQPFAGPNQGMHFPLRPGTEVLVVFIDGDPDRPIIVGAVPNTVTPSVVTAVESQRHRIQSHHGLLVQFGKSLA
ncbi:MAG: type VI secretion system tip protein TssI/VgrG [Polyangiaceae bacterium]